MPQFLHLQAGRGEALTLGGLSAGTELMLQSWGVQDLIMAVEPATVSFPRRDQLPWYLLVSLEHGPSLTFCSPRSPPPP